MLGQDVVRYAAWWQSYLDLGGKENGPDDPIHVTGVKCLSALYELSYWQVSRRLQCIVRFRTVCMSQ